MPVGLQLSNVFMETSSVHIFQLGPTGEAFIFDAAVFGGFNLTDPLGAGIYDLAIIKSSSTGWRWEFTAEVAPSVPIPGSFLLFSSALIMLSFFRRKKT